MWWLKKGLRELDLAVLGDCLATTTTRLRVPPWLAMLMVVVRDVVWHGTKPFSIEAASCSSPHLSIYVFCLYDGCCHTVVVCVCLGVLVCVHARSGQCNKSTLGESTLSCSTNLISSSTCILFHQHVWTLFKFTLCLQSFSSIFGQQSPKRVVGGDGLASCLGGFLHSHHAINACLPRSNSARCVV